MKEYEDFLLERVQNLTGKLAQKQREGNLAEELALCVRLAQLHTQLDSPKIALQFWQSCMQIAADLEDEEEIWRAAAEISKIYCSSGQIEDGENFLRIHLNLAIDDDPEANMRLVLLKVDVIMAMGQFYRSKKAKIHEFGAYERALKLIDEALDRSDDSKKRSWWWWEGVLLRGQILSQLGRFDESRIEEALEVIKTVQSGASLAENVLLDLRIRLLLCKIYFEMREYATSLEFAVSAIDLYKLSAQNANFRPRRRVYCEALKQAGLCLHFQKDFVFSMENLLLAREEAKAVAVESEFMSEIDSAIQASLRAKSAADEASLLERRLSVNASPKDLEELAGIYEEMGDYCGAAELLERCRSVAVNESTLKRLNKKLMNLYADRLKNWQAVLKIYDSSSSDQHFRCDYRNLIVKARACEKLSRFQESEESYLSALKFERSDASLQAFVYFHYLFRGQSMKAEGYRAEGLSLEAVEIMQTWPKTKIVLSIDPNFSYFATRKPSNSLMKMVGSGMVMRTKTRKTKGLELKRRRGGGGGPKTKTRKLKTIKTNLELHAEQEGRLSDFIVSGSDSEEFEGNVKGKSILIISSSSESESGDFSTVSNIKNNSQHTRKEDRLGLFQLNDSPLLIRTSSLSLNNKESDIKKVTVRIKRGVEFVVPLGGPLQRVDSLLKEAQKRFEKLFPQEFARMGPIRGISLGDGLLFPEDELNQILSRDSEVLEAHFDKKAGDLNGVVSDSSSSTRPLDGGLEEDFRRKFQVLNLKSDNSAEISALKELQNRFRSCGRELNLSALALDSTRLAEYSSFFSKFWNCLSSTDLMKQINLAENYLCDGDLKVIFGRFGGSALHTTTTTLDHLDLSMNFLTKPPIKCFQGCKYVNLAYNPIDLDWLSHHGPSFEWGINIIGCFEGADFNTCETNSFSGWSDLGRSLSSLRRLEFSFPKGNTVGLDAFLKSLCGESSRIEELSVFGVEWRGELLLELSYLPALRELNLTGCRFDGNLGPLYKIIKRCGCLKRVILLESDINETELIDLKSVNENDYRSIKIEI